jgi:hypothetical protein
MLIALATFPTPAWWRICRFHTRDRNHLFGFCVISHHVMHVLQPVRRRHVVFRTTSSSLRVVLIACSMITVWYSSELFALFLLSLFRFMLDYYCMFNVSDLHNLRLSSLLSVIGSSAWCRIIRRCRSMCSCRLACYVMFIVRVNHMCDQWAVLRKIVWPEVHALSMPEFWPSQELLLFLLQLCMQ